MTATRVVDDADTEIGVNQACASAYLALRQVPEPGMQWISGVGPVVPELPLATVNVQSTDDILDALVAEVEVIEGAGLLLSGGIDSAILAALVAPDTPCYTIAFDAPGAIDESAAARRYAQHWGHPHRTIRVRWTDYLEHMALLFQAKAAPLHAIEVPLYVAATAARADGLTALIVGNGADSTFGGMDKLLSQDWSFEGFVDRYRFADPAKYLTRPTDVTPVFEPYRTDSGIDVQRFLKEIHGRGIVHSFENAIGAAGLRVAAPYEQLSHDSPLDMRRIRSGEPKYLLQDVFRGLYDTDRQPRKIAFARPMDVWLEDWRGPLQHPIFRAGAVTETASPEARWLLFCLDAFLTALPGMRRG